MPVRYEYKDVRFSLFNFGVYGPSYGALSVEWSHSMKILRCKKSILDDMKCIYCKVKLCCSRSSKFSDFRWEFDVDLSKLKVLSVSVQTESN